MSVSMANSPVLSPSARPRELSDDASAASPQGATLAPPVARPVSPHSPQSKAGLESEASSRAEELLGVLASFPVALHHHIIGIRALPHPPLIDLLPAGYLSSLKRTDARVRFAASHAEPSGSGSPKTKNGHANGLDKEKEKEKEGSDDDSESGLTKHAKKSNLQTPYPANLPLSLLRLMEAYILGLGGLPSERGGWASVQTERALDVVKGLNVQLSIAEGVYDGESVAGPHGRQWSLHQSQKCRSVQKRCHRVEPRSKLTLLRTTSTDRRPALPQHCPGIPTTVARDCRARLDRCTSHYRPGRVGQIWSRAGVNRARSRW